MSDLSAGQKKYLLQHKKHKRIVCVSRILILLSFLFIWEFTANVGIIDSFIFSSPSKIALCFWAWCWIKASSSILESHCMRPSSASCS